MKKILMVSCEGLGNGGVQSVMMNTVRGLSKQYQFDVLLFTSQKRFYDDEFLGYGGKIIRVPFYEGKNKIRKSADYYIRGSHLYSNVLREVRKNGPYAAIHCNNAFESAICLRVGKKLGIPVRICQAHTIAEYGNPVRSILNNLYKKWILQYSTNLIGCSQEACVSFYGKRADIEVLRNPYNSFKYSFSPNKSCNNKGLALIQVGAFSVIKNQIYTLKVFNLLEKQIPDAHLHLVGFDMDGIERQLQEYVFKNGLKNKVTFWKGDADIPKIMTECDAFILPSLYEGFGISLIEAQAFGLKCYASNTVPKTTNVGGCNYFDLNDDINVLVDKLVNDYMCGKMKRQQYDTSQFSLEKYLIKIQSIYEGNKYS